MATDTTPPNPQASSPTPPQGPQVRCAPGIVLEPEHVELLYQAFPSEKMILVKEEFRSGYSGAVVILVTVGAGRAPLVVKFAHPHDLQQEYDAYVEFVRKVSPQNIAHLQGEPIVSEDGQVGMIQYTFAGGESHLPTNSLAAYYETSGAEETAAVLNRIFRVYGRHWWANNHAESYVLDEYYDRLLPVHFQAKQAQSGATATYTIRAGESSMHVAQKAQIGEVVQLLNVAVTKARYEGRKLTLRADPPASEATAPLRVRVEGEEPTNYRPGDVVDSMLVEITATRMSLLGDAAASALPGFDPQAARFTLPSGSGDSPGGSRGIVLPNPLVRLPEQLYKVVETKMSVIHGDLNLQNVLVDAPTGFSWLIDFAETRIGPTLLDLQRLEVQVITKLMPEEGEIPLAAVVEMMTRLHADPPLPAPPQPELQEPYTLLVTIRRLARQYLMDDLDWNEYYDGLVVALIGALKYDELDDTTRRLALVCAASADSLIGKPLQQTTPTGATDTQLIVTAAANAPAEPTVAPAPVAAEQATAKPAAAKRSPVVPPAKPPAASAQRALEATPVPAAAAKPRSRAAGIVIGAVTVLLVALAAIWFTTRTSRQQTASTGEADPVAHVAATEHASEGEAGGTVSGDSVPAAGAVSGQTDTPAMTSTGAIFATPSPDAPASAERQATSEATESATREVTETATSEPSETATGTPETTPDATGVLGDTERAASLESLVTLNVRGGPGTGFPTVGSLTSGNAAAVIGRALLDGDLWYQIEFPVDSGDSAWITGNPSMVEIKGADDVPLLSLGDLPAPPAAPAQSATAQAGGQASSAQGAIYYSATDRGVDNVYRVQASGGSPVLVVERARQPALSASSELLAYQNMDSGTLGVSVLNLGNNRATRYTSSPEDGLPSWSPNENSLIYASNREGDRAYRLFVTGGGSGDLALGRGSEPDWHPTQDLIVYRGCDDSGSRCGLWTMTGTGFSRQPLTDDASDSRPKWSPDGRTVVFMSRNRHGNWEIYSVDARSGAVSRLTDHPANDGHPVFSPDGGSVAFLTNRGSGAAWEIQTMDSDGNDLRTVVSLGASLPDWLAQGLDWVR